MNVPNKLLARQLRRTFGVSEPAELAALASGSEADAARVLGALPAFVAAVGAAYAQADRDLELRSRSLDLSSDELNGVNERLRSQMRAQTRAIEALHESASQLVMDGAHERDLHATADLEGLSGLVQRLAVERRSTQERLARSEAKFRSLSALSADWYWEMDAGLRFTDSIAGDDGLDCRSGAEAKVGKARWEIAGLAPVDGDWSSHRADLEARRSFRDFRMRDSTLDSGEQIVSVSGEPVFDDAGTFLGYRGIGSDITERCEREVRLAESEAKARRLALVAERTSNAVSITDAQGRIEWVNEAFETLTGYASTEAFGRRIDELLHGAQTDRATVAACRARLAAGEAVQTELLYYRSDGTSFWSAVSLAPVADADGRSEAVVGVQRDISVSKAAEQALREAALAAEAANRAKSEFVANMSHEIRTPMNGVLGMTELLLDAGLSEGQLRYVRNIRRSASALLTVIDDILDFSKLEAGRLELDPVEFDLRDLIEDVIALAATEAQARGIEICCDMAADMPSVVRGDAGRMRQVLTNLVGNAVKFTERGEVVLTASRGGGNRVSFRVRDTGIGISAQVQERLFTAFTQADGSMSRRFGGTGLGLAISRSLVRLMGGEIALESVVGTGSVFRFEVPLETVFVASGVDGGESAVRGQSVLIVEDNHCQAGILQRTVEGWGVLAAVAHDALAAAEAIDRQMRGGRPFDVALIDADLSGNEAAADLVRKIHRCGAAHGVVLMESCVSAGRERATHGLGACVRLRKPLRRNDLLRVFTRSVRDASDPAHSAQPVRPAQGLSVSGRALLVEDNAINQEIGSAMLASLGVVVEVAGNGIEAVGKATTGHFDIVLMDCQLPGMDGFDATRQIRMGEAAKGASRMPVVAVTANAMQGDRERCLAAGMDDYLTKPYTRAQLEKMLGRWMRRESADMVPAQGTEVDVIERRALDNIRALERPESPGLLARVIERYLKDAESLYASIQQAAGECDAAALVKAAHSLKSASANLGAGGAASICRTLETAARSGDLGLAGSMVAELRGRLDEAAGVLRAEIGSTP